MLRSLAYVFYCEGLLLFRHSREWLYPLCFFLIVISLFPLAFSPDLAFTQQWLPGYIWVAALFANLLAMQSAFSSDNEDGHMEQLLLSDMPLSLLLFIKLLALWLANTLPIILLTPILGYILGLSMPIVFITMLSLLLGTPILALLGGFAVALTLSLQQKGVLLGLLILPLATPVLIFAITLIHQAQAGIAISGAFAFLAGLSLLSILFAPLLIAFAIRIGIDD